MEKLVKKAIDYMEDHLLENIDICDIASNIYVSQFHLHRIFKALTNLSVSEYIRNRRLSLAGLDILGSEDSILSIAMKYQYNSSEGFSKAFYRFHGVNPMKARKERRILQTYQPLKIHISFEGGRSMDYKIVKKDPFTLLCVRKAFKNTIIEEENNHQIPDFWTEKLNDGTVKELLTLSGHTTLYGPCNAVDKTSDSFYYGIGVPYTGEDVNKYDLWHIEHPLYAVFICKTIYDMGATWKSILEEFLPNSEYEMADQTDFELYPNKTGKHFCEIWVPIQ